MPESAIKRPLIGVSSCLLGKPVRYDGVHKANDIVLNTLSRYFDFKAFCPEVEIGLGVPRKPIRLIQTDRDIRCVGVADANFDVTDQLLDITQQQKNWHESLSAYIFKKNSPSCGLQSVKIFQGDHFTETGIGIYAQALIKSYPSLPVIEETDLSIRAIREAFIKTVLEYHQSKYL